MSGLHDKSNRFANSNTNEYRRLIVVCPFEASKPEIVNLFSRFGKLEDIRMTKTSINTAMVKFFKASEALKSLEDLNGFLIQNYKDKLQVSLANLSDPNHKLPIEPYKIFVNINKQIKFNDLANTFRKFGTILNCYIPVDHATNLNKGFGFVTFSKASEAAKAIEECGKLGFYAKFEFGHGYNNNKINLINNPLVSNKENEKCPNIVPKQNANIFKNITNNNLIPINLTIKREIDDDDEDKKIPLKKRKIENESQLNETDDQIQTNSLIVFSNVHETILKSLFELITGLTEFKKLKEGEYSVVYSNEICADFAFQKLNRFKTSFSRYDSIVVKKRIDLKNELMKKLNENNKTQERMSYMEYFMSQFRKPFANPVDSKKNQTCEVVSNNQTVIEKDSRKIYNWLI